MAKRHHAGETAHRAVARIEERVLATRGGDPFEVVFARLAAHTLAFVAGATRSSAAKALATLAIAPSLAMPPRSPSLPSWMREIDALLLRALDLGGDEAFDVVFETLTARGGKGEKGQFFTPLPVVRFVARALNLQMRETVCDPACGGGAFLGEALRAGAVPFGGDIDARAVRVARLRLLALGAKKRAAVVLQGDSLAHPSPWSPGSFDCVLTNPPFAGESDSRGFALAALSHGASRLERDALFVERALDLLRPGGRFGIVLPHGKLAGPAWTNLRTFVHQRARIVAAVSLPKETFLPHTGQRTAALFAIKRAPRERPKKNESVLLAVSERACRDAAGDPRTDHDLGPLALAVAEHFSRC